MAFWQLVDDWLGMAVVHWPIAAFGWRESGCLEWMNCCGGQEVEENEGLGKGHVRSEKWGWKVGIELVTRGVKKQ